MTNLLKKLLLAGSIAAAPLSAEAGTVSTNYSGRLEIINSVNGTNSVPAVVNFTSNPNATYGWDSGLDTPWASVPLNGQSGAYVKQGVFDAGNAFVPNNSMAPVTIGLTYNGSVTNASHSVALDLPLFTPAYTFSVLQGNAVLTNGVVSADTTLNLPTWPNGVSGGNAARRTLRLEQIQGSRVFNGVQPSLDIFSNGDVVVTDAIQKGVTGRLERATSLPSLPAAPAWVDTGITPTTVFGSNAVFQDPDFSNPAADRRLYRFVFD